MEHAKFMKLLNAQINTMKREHKFLEGQLEKHTRYAYTDNVHTRKIEREIVKLEKQMTAVENAVKRFPNSCNSYI